jgi:hypothetical protein
VGAKNMRADDLFEFWADVPGSAREHPADATVLSRAKHKFRLDCLPSPVFGPLRSVRVVCLFLAPGFDQRDVPHAVSASGQSLYQRQRTGDALLPTEAEFPAAWKWWNDKVATLLPAGLKLADVRGKVAFLNIAAYKSAGDFEDYHMLAALPSSRVCLSWAWSVLFPQAERGERVVVSLRSAERWGFKPEEKYGLLFAPKTVRSGMRDLPFKYDVIEAIAQALRA